MGIAIAPAAVTIPERIIKNARVIVRVNAQIAAELDAGVATRDIPKAGAVRLTDP
jgi:hypothetical protein